MACTYPRQIFDPNDIRVINFDKEILVYNQETLNTFLKEAFPSFYNQGWNPNGRQINDAFVFYEVEGQNSRVFRPPYTGLGATLYDWINDNLAKSEGIGTLKQSGVLTTLTAPPGIPQTPEGRINLGSVGGNPCEAGFYGFIGEIWELKIPIFKVCYFDVSARSRGVIPNGITQFDTIVRIEKMYGSYEYTEVTKNESGPIIITDDISIAAGKGISIVPDYTSCSPFFNATDYDFGEVNFEKGELTGKISITNESKIDFVITGITPAKNANFSIGNFITVDPNDPFLNRSPLSLPFELKSGETRDFEIKYNPLGEFGVLHEVDIKYTVRTNSGKDITEQKLTSKLQARPYKLSVECSDIDWGIVDVKNLPGENIRELTISNNGTKDIYLIDYSFGGIDTDNFEGTTLPDVSLNSPLLIETGKTKTFSLQYLPNNVYSVLHTAKIDFKFFYQNPITGFFEQEVKLGKITSILRARAFKQNIDILLDEDLFDLIFTDDNGVYAYKTISKLVNKSAPISNWKTKGLWTCVGERLDTYFTSSNFKENNQYYLSVYNKKIDEPESYHQFDISFGHIAGSGSKYVVNSSNMRPSEVMYKKYLVECYPPTSSSGKSITSKFKFKNDVHGDYVYFIQTHRDQFKHMLDPGNFQLALSPLSGSSNQTINTGSNVQLSQTSGNIYTLIDESYDTRQKETDDKNLREWYYLTSGSLQHGVYSEDSDNAWGIVFPKIGLIVLDGVVLDQSCSFNTVTASINGENSHKLFLSISGSSSTTAVRNYSSSFYARSSEKVVRETYFCQIGVDEFNYSNNPTYFSGSANYFKYDGFKAEPNSYITSIGLYNKVGDLIALGKLKNPVLKNRHRSYVFQVSLKLN